MNDTITEITIPSEWTHSCSAYPRMATVVSLFEQQANLHAQRVAVTDGICEVRYDELNQRANRLAHRFIQAGSKTGDRIAIVARRSIEMVVGMLAVLKSGGAYVPLDMDSPAERTHFVIEDAGVRSILSNGTKLPGSAGAGRNLVPLTEGTEKDQSDENLQPTGGPEDAAYVMYTSGSTGAPKGVEVTHRGIIRLVRNTNYIDLGPSDVMGQIANPAFDAITFEVWGALLNGGRLAIIPTETVLSTGDFARTIRREGITTMFLTASLFSIMAATEPKAFANMRTLMVGGDAVDPNAARKVLSLGRPARLVNGYGPTECTTFSVCHLIDTVEDGAKSVPIGRPISNSEAYILDERLLPIAPGVAGDLYLGGDGLAKGYLNRPELTRERFIAHPFDTTPGARLYKTGDRARFLANGLIDFLGRQDHQVKFHGFRIELPEIEIALRRHASVVDAVAQVWKRAENDERLVGYVSARPGTVDELLLRRYLQNELPSYMVPNHIVVMAALPMNSVGKIDRAALPEPQLRNWAYRESLAHPLELEIAKIWQEVLQVDARPDDNFFDLGGTSLTLALVESRLRAITNVPFTITDLFTYPSVRALSKFLAGQSEVVSSTTTGRARGTQQRAAFRPLR